MTMTYFLKVKDSDRDHFSRLNVTISQTVTDRANIIIANMESCLLVCLHLTLAYSKGQSHDHDQILNVTTSQTATDRTSIVIANTQEVAYRLSIGIFTFNLGPF